MVDFFAIELSSLQRCCLCPRQCGVDRTVGPTGFCRTDAGYGIASITLHRGEEPAIGGENGICNVFFEHCNLQCKYCQNFQISCNENRIRGKHWSLEGIVDMIIETLATNALDRLGFVSPSHMVPQMVSIVREVHRRGVHPVIIYNSNGYDRVETLRQLEEHVDIYLPDCKYMDPLLAQAWSGASDYPRVAAAALREMYRQKGNILHVDDAGKAERGLIVRHLVLPGATDNSLAVLNFLAAELSSRITLSLMAQYRPIARVEAIDPLNRRLLPDEYALVVAEMERLGFCNGWIQEFASADYYSPNFDNDAPFEE